MSKSARSQFIRSCKRRGNALILVAGVLVLLVIIATVFLSRTRTLRELGTAQRQGAFHRDRMESAAGEIAQELADSLFVRTIDFTAYEYDSGKPPEEARRKAPDVSATRYGVDPDFAWNRAPWAVVPWTNPPDWLTWPLRPGKLRQMVNDREIQVPPDLTTTTWRWIEDRQGGQVDLFNWPNAPESWPPATEPYFNAVLQPRENPLGGPGVSDTRWLRDLEPQRTAPRWLGKPLDVNGWNAILNPFLDRAAGAYSHWRHLSWIGRPGNGWRMCPDIADVTGIRSNIDADGHRFTVDSGSDPVTWADGRAYYGGVYQRNDVPLEQWPATLPMEYDPLSNRLVRLADSNPDYNEAYKFGDTATAPYRFDDPLVSVTLGAQDLSGPPDEVVMDFWDRWLTWLRPEGYRQAITAARGGSGHMLPPNFYDLDDLDGDGVRGEYYDPSTIDPNHPDYDPSQARWGETPTDEFRPGTARWNVSRILTDTDGDGFTDSFWWLSPHVGVDGTRQVIGVSVTDNSGRLNGNVATRFVKNDDAGAVESTRGWTPADLALVSQNYGPVGDGELAPDEAPVWNTGFFDIEAHQPGLLGELTWDDTQAPHPYLTEPYVTYPADGQGSGRDVSEGVYITGLGTVLQGWNSKYWRKEQGRAYLEQLNIDPGGSNPNPFFPDVYPHDISDRDNRLFYFRESGQEPQHPENIFTPFNLADELELRAYEGNNHGWIYSRLERALGPSGEDNCHILRGNLTRMEAGEAAEQLDNRQLAHDLRHRLTFFNGARNETLPPHLWWEHRAPAPRADDIVVGGDLPGTGLVAASDIRVEDMHERFNEQMREKIDLREWERASRSLPSFNTEYDPRSFSERLAQGLLLGLTSGHVSDRDPGGNLIDPETGQTIPFRGGRDSYFGSGDEAWEKTRRLAAAMTANMLASRDPDQTQPLLSIEGVVSGAPTPGEWHAELGAVPLPFFEGAYYPDDLAAHTDPDNTGDIVFPGGETESVGGSTDPDQLRSDWSYGGGGGGNKVSDFMDLSDIGIPQALLPDPAVSGCNVLEPWDLICVGIDGDGDGLADWSESRPWCATDTGDVVWRAREPNGGIADCDGGINPPVGYDLIPAWAEAYAPEVHMLGMEPQPFISEVFFAEVAKPWMFPDELICQNSDCMNAGSWYWIGNHTEREELSLFGAGDPAGNATIDGDDLPDIPRAIFAVQLVNPYSKAIPLMRRNENTGQLEPIYKLRFLTPNRFQSSTASTTWEIPLDPTTLGAMRTSQRFRDPIDDDIDELVPSFALDPTNDPIPMLPPATNDAPYSLMIVLNGMELAPWRGQRITGSGGIGHAATIRPSEVVQWLDFLDAEPSRHPSGHWVNNPEILDPDDPDSRRPIEPGELIWRIDPARLATLATPIDPEQITKPTWWYRADVGSTGGFLGPTIDPNLGSMVELVRTHQSDIGSYTADVVIDRTAGLDGIDELLHVVGGQLPLHTIAASEEIEHAFQSGAGTGFVSFEPDMPEFAAEAGRPLLENHDITYPKALQRRYRDPETGNITEANDPSALNGAGMNSLVELGASRPQWEALGIDPWDARWMQWGRYSRAWAVDDVDEQRTMDTQPDTAIDGPDFDDVNEANRRLWRPDRAAPRFVAGAGRVTRSWSRDWANQLGLQPDPPAQYVAAPPTDWNPDPEALSGQSFDLEDVGGAVQWPPVVAAKTFNGTDIDHGYRASYNSLWGLDLGGDPSHVIGAGNPVLVGGNLPDFGPERGQGQAWTGTDWARPQLAWDRRWAEQKMGMASGAKLAANQTIIDATGLENWDSWTVNDPDTNTRRRINLVVIGDPANDWDKNNDGLLDDIDSRLPANSSMLTDAIAGGNGPVEVPPAILPFREDDGELPAKWEFGWRGRGAPGTFAATDVTEHWDSYQSAMRFKHGNIINWKWDPDGIGRLEEGSGDEFPFLGSDNVSEDSYSEENPYPYPWATRNVRLPWSYSIHESEEADFDFDTDEYYLYEARKPTFFAFGHQRNVDGTVYESDRGYNPTEDPDEYVQSYPDKGFYGPAEIDGEILMPFGYQVQLKDANFEQIGEVLEIPTIAHELFIPLAQPDLDVAAVRPSWPADYYYNQDNTLGWPPVFDFDQLNEIQTIKTYSEALAEEIAAGAGKSAGHLQLGGTIDGPNAIVGDPRTTYEVVDGQLVIHEPYDLVSSGGRIPDWYLAANDVSHIGPDLPAVQRLLDLFVVDGPGIYDLVESNPDDLYSFNSPWPDGYIDDPEDWALYADPPTAGQLAARSANFDNAGGFEGRPTRGLVNINTASVEVLRSMPHMYRMVHGDPNGAATPLLDQFSAGNLDPERPYSPHPRTAVPEAIAQYRDGLGHVPSYNPGTNRPNFFDPLWDSDLSSPDPFLLSGVPDGAPYLDRGLGLPRNAWGLDQVPGTIDDVLVDLDAKYDLLADAYNMPALADTEADETIRYSRGTRGFAGIGELLQLTRPAYYDFGFVDTDRDGEEDLDLDLREPLGTSVAADAWRIDWSGRNPFGWQDSQVHGLYGNASGGTTLWDERSGFDSNGNRLRDALDNPGAFLSTDTDRYHDTQVPGLSDFEPVASWPANERWEDPLGGYGGFQHAGTDDPRYRELHLTGDRVAGDAEEQSLLFSGISNLVTTRSDVFTVHLRVRTFRRNPETGVWDATDRSQIVDDSRYVMLVDRSEVDHPGDKPRIMLMQRIAD